MAPRARQMVTGIALLVALLFVGRWSAVFVAERWWAARISDSTRHFVTEWMLLGFTLEAAGILLACLWFVGHLLIVYRAIGTVQVRRQLGNLEIREAVNLRALAFICVGGGLLLGLIAGRGLGGQAATVLLGWTGVHYGVADPLLGRDLGFYLATLPAIELLRDTALLLTVSALFGVASLYVVIGAIRRSEGRLEMNDHARLHLGALAILLALLLAWGYLLEPFRLAGGLGAGLEGGHWPFRRTLALVLAGTAALAAVVSLFWSLRARHTLLLGVWLLLGASDLVGTWVLPALVGGEAGAALTAAERRHFDQLAYGMSGLRDTILSRGDGPPMPPRPAAFWQVAEAADVTAADSGRVVAAERAVVSVGGRPRPVWLVVRDHGGEGAGITAVLDDRTSDLGRAILFREGDTLAAGTADRPSGLQLPPRGVWPRGPTIVVDTAGSGVMVGAGLRRLVLAWALQSIAFLGPAEGNEQAFWHLDPGERLARIAPFAVWGQPSPHLASGGLFWVVDGYLPSEAFPGSTRVLWQGNRLGALRAEFVGVIQAETGDTRIYLRHNADEVGKQWQLLSEGLIAPPSAIPSEVLRAFAYPGDLLEVQLQVLAHPHWGLGEAPVLPEQAGFASPRPDAVWSPDTSGVEFVVPFAANSQRQVSAVVRARVIDGWETLGILRVDSLLSLPAASGLRNRWEKFPTFLQLRDSAVKAGARLESGAVRYWPTSVGLGAYQPHFIRREGQEPVLAWVSVALPDHRGAGHDLTEAWQNLLGLSAPIISAGERGANLLEARRHLRAAEAALRRGDLEAFGRAWEALKRTIGAP